MAWYWPSINDVKTAKEAASSGVRASAIVACVMGLAATLSIVYGRPILGMDGWALVDAGLFAIAAWRMKKMSRVWSVLGLVLYMVEISDRIVTSPGAVTVLSILLILGFLNAIRGTFAARNMSQ